MDKSWLTEITLNERCCPLLYIGCERNEYDLGFLFNPSNYLLKINRFPWDWSGQVHLRPVGSFYVGLNPAWIPLGVKRTDTPGILIQGQIYRNSFIAQCHNFSHHSPLREGKWAKKSRAGKIWTSCKTHFFHVLKNISDFTLIIERLVVSLVDNMLTQKGSFRFLVSAIFPTL